MERLPAWPPALQTPGLWVSVGQSKARNAPVTPVKWAQLGDQQRGARGQPAAPSRSQPRIAPVFPCHLHMNEGKIGHQLFRSEMEMVFQMGWEGPRVPVRHTSNSRLTQESKMLIERAQSYSPAHCCFRAARRETSRCLIAVTGGERPPDCLQCSRSPSHQGSVPSWGQPLPAWQVSPLRHGGMSPRQSQPARDRAVPGVGQQTQDATPRTPTQPLLGQQVLPRHPQATLG